MNNFKIGENVSYLNKKHYVHSIISDTLVRIKPADSINTKPFGVKVDELSMWSDSNEPINLIPQPGKSFIVSESFLGTLINLEPITEESATLFIDHVFNQLKYIKNNDESISNDIGRLNELMDYMAKVTEEYRVIQKYSKH